MTSHRVLALSLLACVLLTGACRNRVTSTRECLGRGGITSTYTDYAFDVDEGPAIDVAGDCHVVLERCTIRAPMGIRAREDAVVTVVGGTLEARGAAVIASDKAKVSFAGTAVTGRTERSGNAEIRGLR